MKIDVPEGSKYKLWLELEIELPEDPDAKPGEEHLNGADFGLIPDCVGTYDTLDEALNAARSFGCDLEF